MLQDANDSQPTPSVRANAALAAGGTRLLMKLQQMLSTSGAMYDYSRFFTFSSMLAHE